mgnify:FL=1|jgi:hypothetical protein
MDKYQLMYAVFIIVMASIVLVGLMEMLNV